MDALTPWLTNRRDSTASYWGKIVLYLLLLKYATSLQAVQDTAWPNHRLLNRVVTRSQANWQIYIQAQIYLERACLAQLPLEYLVQFSSLQTVPTNRRE